MSLHVLIFEHFELLFRRKGIRFLLTLEDSCLVLVKSRLQGHEVTYCPIDLSEAFTGPGELPTVATHVVILVFHRLDGAVGHSLQALIVGIDSQETLVAILLLLMGSKGGLHAPVSRDRGQPRVLAV